MKTHKLDFFVFDKQLKKRIHHESFTGSEQQVIDRANELWSKFGSDVKKDARIIQIGTQIFKYKSNYD